MKILQFLFLFVVIQQIAYAFKVTPMVVQFNSKGDGKTQTFTASNTKSQKVAVEVVAKTRSLNLQGEEKRSDTQSFVIFPPQLILSPGQTKKIRVTYVGGPLKGEEDSFRIIFRQLPVELKKEKVKPGAQLKFLFEYVASVYVSAENQKPGVLKASRAQLVNNNGKSTQTGALRSWKVLLKNEGGTHALMRDYHLSYQVITQDKKKSKPKESKRRIVDFRLKNQQTLPNLLAASQVEVYTQAPKLKKNQRLIWTLIKK